MKGDYDNYDYFKSYSQVKCSNCEDVIIDLGWEEKSRLVKFIKSADSNV